jgi:hypothetical protein
MLDRRYLQYYFVSACAILIGSYLVSKWQEKTSSPNDEYRIIRQYLLNDSPLYGYNRPKLWIHTKYEINARHWKDFYSRNSTDLNEPYIHLCIKTIIDHCGDDFHICLIDDQTFSQLIPSWDIDLSTMAEPKKSQFRELALMQLLYYYGGMLVPNSFVCMKNLAPLYKKGIARNQPFVCENINRSMDGVRQRHRLLFTPDNFFMGVEKNDPLMLEFVEYLKQRNRKLHFSNEFEFLGDSQRWCVDAVNKMHLHLVGGEIIGVKTKDRKTILIEDLLEEGYLDLHEDIVGIYIPNEEILRRPKFQWFAVLPRKEILQSNMIISKYILASILDGNDEYSTNESRSVVTI